MWTRWVSPPSSPRSRGVFSEKSRRESAIRGTLLGSGILFLFALAGDVLPKTLGIGLPAFRIAGGLLLFLLALGMIFARSSQMRASTVRQQREESYQQDIPVFPLAIPLLAGPGAITTVLLYTGGSDAAQVAAFVFVLLVVLLLTLASLLLAPRVMRLFGDTGANVLSRVLGVLLAALAVQFVLDGLRTSLA
ncbi:MAG TPA: MarC family protein [Rubrobacter sp.]|nr:MarC family protein [Rubrobacter sp.]